MGLSHRNYMPEMSDRRKELLNKSDAAERQVWWKYFMLVALILAALFFFADIVAQWFPNLNALALILAVPLSIGTGFICHVEFGKLMKSIGHATQAADYLEKNSVNVTASRDEFVIYKSYANGSVEETSDDPNKGNF